MRRLGTVLLVLLVVVVVATVLLPQIEKPADDLWVRRPPPQDVPGKSGRRGRSGKAEGPLIGPPSSGDPSFEVVSSPPVDSSGTAFAIDWRGHWLTARHVVDGCDRVGILVRPRYAMFVETVEIRTDNDLALLSSTYAKPGLPVRNPEIHKGQDGFGFGFPKDQWTGIHLLLLGRAWQRTKGRYGFTEPVLNWSVRSHRPEKLSAYSGLSGGPLLNDEGLVIGVFASGSRRRGRLTTVAPATLTGMLEERGLRIEAQEMAALDTSLLTKAKYPKFGDILRKHGAVSQVWCDVQD